MYKVLENVLSLLINQVQTSELDSLVPTLFIDISNTSCFGTDLPISMYKDVYQCRHFK